MTTNGRGRWAALGAAVAISLGAGGLGVVNATISSGTKAVFVPITPCRLVDTRPAPTTVGGRATPLNAGEIATFTVHGSNGNCTIPAGATSIATNVTITAPTSDGFLTMFPADAALPNASNLNWAAGQAPTPNAVTVDLSADGKVKVFNERGTVNVIIDIVGYYEDHNHDDSYYTKAQVDAWIATNAASTSTALATKADVAQALPPLFAAISSAGTVYSGISSGLVSSSRLGVGQYTVTFNRSVKNCAVATSDLVFAGTRDVSADVTFSVTPGRVDIRVTDDADVPEDTYFNVVVACPPLPVLVAGTDEPLEGSPNLD